MSVRGAGRGPQPSDNLLRCAAWFGLTLAQDGRLAEAPVDAARRVAGAQAQRIDRLLGPGRVAAVWGPSGCGKTTVLRRLRSRLGARAVWVGPRPRVRRGALCDLDPLATDAAAAGGGEGPLRQWLGCLARAGLADAWALDRPAALLSDGQRWRLSLAQAMRRAQAQRRGCTLLIDEFGSSLDADTLRAVCVALRRWLTHHPTMRAVVATVHPGAVAWLRPSLRLGLGHAHDRVCATGARVAGRGVAGRGKE
ncbi:MAG: hypothetical protein C0475_08285 [Planctomyces sp.]|nr:hypothetical protein [Planctomyces sp.]MBA4120376.1 hypothetical protein [Isosphaera sp.]